MEQPFYAEFQIIKPPPFRIFGGKTHWEIRAEYYGKNGGKLALIAHCVETKEQVNIVDGATRTVVHSCSSGFTLNKLTLAYQIMKAAAKAGFVKMTVTPPYQPSGPSPYPPRPPKLANSA